MKTKEFIKKVKSLGFKARVEYDGKGELAEFRIGNGEQDFVVISNKFTFAISTIEDGFTDLKYPLPLKELYNLCFEYASTPVKDREEEKKFYLKHRYLVQAGDYTTAFLNYDINNDRLYVYTKVQTYSVKTKFTLKEIEKIKVKFDTDLADFELVEVEE